jgi:hypothetical protein
MGKQSNVSIDSNYLQGRIEVLRGLGKAEAVRGSFLDTRKIIYVKKL